MELHERQIAAIEAAKRAVQGGSSLLIKGPAGTGKSTVALEALRFVQEAAQGREIYSCALTNKAVGRMIEIGFPKNNAMTCHRLLYQTEMFFTVKNMKCASESVVSAMKMLPKKGMDAAIPCITGSLVIDEEILESQFAGKLDKAAKFFIEAVHEGNFEKETATVLRPEYNRSDIIFVDEVGMLPLEMAEIIRDRYDTVIFMGDHRQLEPVNGPDTINVIDVVEEVTLTHVFRSGSQILKLASFAEQDMLGDCGVMSQTEFNALAVEGYVFLAHTNKDVYSLNVAARAAIGFHGRPKDGEELIAMENLTGINKIKTNSDWLDQAIKAKAIDKDAFTIKPIPGDDDFVYRVYRKRFTKNMTMKANGAAFMYEDEVMIGVYDNENPDYLWYIRTTDFWNFSPEDFQRGRNVGTMNVFFAYAMTVHRSQGSEWPKVCVKIRDKQSESWGPNKAANDISRPRFNYTGITRAKEHAIVTSQIAIGYQSFQGY